MNERLLKAETVRAGMNFSELAEKAGISKSGFYARLKKGSFTQHEICAIQQVLGLSRELMVQIFFGDKVS